MISTLPKIAPISDMRLRQADIVKQAQQGPVVLVERGSKPSLVVITPELWDAIAQRMEDLEDAAAVWKKRWELATGQDELIEIRACKNTTPRFPIADVDATAQRELM